MKWLSDMQPPPPALLLLWAAWIAQAVLSVLIVRRFLARFDKRTRSRVNDYQPFASVIVPFRGLEPDLADGVKSLFEQDYPDYRVLLVVDSANDPACAVLRKVMAMYPQREAHLLIAGPAAPNEGQKLHNHVHAIDHLLAHPHESAADDDGDEVWVFADSDAVPGRMWLADLVGPLKHQGKTGATTGYRWLVPAGERGGSVWSRLASVINSSAACMYGRDAWNMAWGGSMALRAETARRGDLRGMFHGALTDDYQLTRMCRKLGLRVYFTHHCLVPSTVDFSFASLCNFAHRQYLLTRVYVPRLFVAVLAILTLYVAGLVTAVAWLALHGRDGWVWPTAALGVVAAANQARAAYRRAVVRRALDESVAHQLRGTLRLDRWCTTGVMIAHWLLVLRACFGRTMRWRGIRYHLAGPQRVRRLD